MVVRVEILPAASYKCNQVAVVVSIGDSAHMSLYREEGVKLRILVVFV